MFAIDCSTFVGWQMIERCINALISQKDNLLDFIWYAPMNFQFHGSFYMEMICFQP